MASLDPRQACCMVALAAVEVLSGSRPLAQLARWVTPEVYDSLARRAALTAPGARVLDPAAGSADVGPSDGAVRRPSVRRVRAFPVSEHVVEASVIVTHADRVRAVAVRLTRATGRWRASALVVG
ncbi:Rv3235 family protein [Cellulomonas endometrii]|uniref:Rv3235 family protein n=1 Tax=Cellulomonas endometrii TaxID=3036301 RepID=UPI0024AE77C0|nr:Rv3235 family protein [Cellulomonas endometrii]